MLIFEGKDHWKEGWDGGRGMFVWLDWLMVQNVSVDR